MSNFERNIEPKKAMDVGVSKEITAILEVILEAKAQFEDNPNGPYESHCPFCDAYNTFRGDENMPDMEHIGHEDDCIYVRAKRIIEKLNEC